MKQSPAFNYSPRFCWFSHSEITTFSTPFIRSWELLSPLPILHSAADKRLGISIPNTKTRHETSMFPLEWVLAKNMQAIEKWEKARVVWKVIRRHLFRGEFEETHELEEDGGEWRAEHELRLEYAARCERARSRTRSRSARATASARARARVERLGAEEVVGQRELPCVQTHGQRAHLRLPHVQCAQRRCRQLHLHIHYERWEESAEFSIVRNRIWQVW